MSLFLPSFEFDGSDEKKLIKRLSIERASDEANAIPKVIEEIKWRPQKNSNISIVDRFDDFIEEPVEEIVRQLRAESDIGSRDQATSTPKSRDVNRPLLNYSIDIELSSNEPGISETIADFVSESEYDSDEDAFFFLFQHFFNEAEMANLTQDMIDTLQQAGQQNTDALVTGMRNLNAQRKLESIPFFSGDSNCTLVIDEWFKIAERVARLAGWTDPQKIIYFQEKLTKSAAHFNDSLTPAQRDVYDDWKDLLLQGLHDNTLTAMKKGELKDLKQEPAERVRDFQKRIDDMYRLAYGVGPATSNDANVVLVRDDTKKGVLLQGLRKEIATLVWNRVDPEATYAQAVDSAIESEKLAEIKKIAQSKDINSAVSAITKDSEKNAAKIKELEDLVKQLSTAATATTQSTRPIDLGDPAVIAAFNTYNNAQTNFPRNSVRFPDSTRSRSVSPFTYNNRSNRPASNASQ